MTGQAETVVNTDMARDDMTWHCTLVAHRRLRHARGQCRLKSGHAGTLYTVPCRDRRNAACSEQAHQDHRQDPESMHVHGAVLGGCYSAAWAYDSNGAQVQTRFRSP